jgi:anti-anti-sigma factor
LDTRANNTLIREPDMNIKRHEKNAHVVLKVTEDLGIRSDLSELRDAVEHCLDKGARNIAVSFTPNSFLSSRAVAVCAQCVGLVHERGGRLAIIRPNEQIRELLGITDLMAHVAVVQSENELGEA